MSKLSFKKVRNEFGWDGFISERQPQAPENVKYGIMCFINVVKINTNSDSC